MESVLFLHAHEVDKLNLFSRLSEELSRKEIKSYVTSFSSFDTNYYKKINITNIEYIPKILNLYKNKSLKRYLEYDNLAEMISFTYKLNRLNNWKCDYSYYQELAKCFIEYLYDFTEKNKISRIVMWNNTNLFDRVTWFFAKKNNIDITVMEQGFFRPFTFTVDKNGVNYENSMPREKSFYSKVEFDKEKFMEYLNKPISKDINLNPNKNNDKIKKIIFRAKDYFKINIIKDELDCRVSNESITKKIKRAILNNNHKSSNDEFDIIKEKYIFIPFQVHDDSQIILNSPYIKDMEELVKTVDVASRKIESDIKFVFKEHPADKGRVDYKFLYDKYKKNSKLLFLNNIDTTELIKNCECVITVNSTVGIEALIENKKVITLGNAFYNIKGIVNNCTELEKLDICIKETMETCYDEELKNKFIYYLRFIYQKEVFWRNPNNKQIEDIVKFILTL